MTTFAKPTSGQTMNVMRLIVLLALCISCSSVRAAAQDLATEVGVAKVDITPTEPQLLAGYGGRDREHEGVDARLWARAMTLGRDDPAIVIAVDNCGVPKDVVESIADELNERTNVPRERVVVCSSHTHSAPTLTGYAPVLWGGRISEAQKESIDRYTRWLQEQLVNVAIESMKNRQSAKLEWGQGRVRFGGNRRVLDDGRWNGFGLQFDGPVDHSLPVLVANDTNGDPIAIWANYACHCTTVGARNFVGGDWVGYANEAIERENPATTSLITIGCGADVGPQPSGSVDLAKQHGESLANEVQRLLQTELTPLSPTIHARLERIDLPFAARPTREQLVKTSTLQNFDGYHARLMLEILDQESVLPSSLEYPIGCWTFGEDLCIVFLAGEVVVDYAVRLKSELDWQRLWINGWSNDVPCYIPSKRVLAEGGYEADFSQIYYAQPTRFAPEIEDLIVEKISDLVGIEFHAKANAPSADFLQPPTGQDWFATRLEEWLRNIDERTREQLRLCHELAPLAQSGFAELVDNDGGVDTWFNYSGIKEQRPFIRQQQRGDTITWKTTPTNSSAESDRQIFVFLGGVGWISQPPTAGFELRIEDSIRLKFDITLEARSWETEDGSVRLHYLPTWTSDVDSGGFFYLDLPKDLADQGKPCTLSVTSLGRGSRRWFSLDPIPNVKSIEEMVFHELGRLED